METKKIWGFVLIGGAVLFGLSGLGSLYGAFTYSSQVADQMAGMAGMAGMYGGESAMAAINNAAANAAPSKLPGLIMLIMAGAGGFFGDKMLKELKQQSA